MKQYKEINGMSFDVNTPQSICNILSNAHAYNWRIRVFYGDAETGKSWNEEFDTIGNVGKSCGKIKIPLLIKNKRSVGGGAILDNCILKIVDIRTNEILYQNSKFIATKFECIGNKVFADGIIYANCKNTNQAQRLCNFMNGLRHNK